jgi:hypothetical protein
MMAVGECDKGYSPYGRQKAELGKGLATRNNFERHAPTQYLLFSTSYLLL